MRAACLFTTLVVALAWPSQKSLGAEARLVPVSRRKIETLGPEQDISNRELRGWTLIVSTLPPLRIRVAAFTWRKCFRILG